MKDAARTSQSAQRCIHLVELLRKLTSVRPTVISGQQLQLPSSVTYYITCTDGKMLRVNKGNQGRRQISLVIY